MNRLDAITRAQVIGCLIEGCSIRSTVRMTGVAKKTVMRLLVEVGEVCADYQNTPHESGNGRWCCRPALECGGFGSPLGVIRAEGGKSGVKWNYKGKYHSSTCISLVSARCDKCR
jgi:hypothetical protein